MSLLTKASLVGFDTDARKTRVAAAVTQIIERQTGRFFGRQIWGISVEVGDVTTITCPGHGFIAGEKVKISGSDSTPSIDGTQTILTTGLTRDTFQVGVNVTVAGTTGWLAKVMTERVKERPSKQLLLSSSPIQSITSITVDTTELESTSYELDKRVDQLGWSGIVDMVFSVGPSRISRGLSGEMVRAIHEVVYVVGCYYLPSDLEECAIAIANLVSKNGIETHAMKSKSIEDYSWTLADSDSLRHLPANVSSILASYRATL